MTGSGLRLIAWLAIPLSACSFDTRGLRASDRGASAEHPPDGPVLDRMVAERTGAADRSLTDSSVADLPTPDLAPCAGARLDGFCWYQGAPDASCDATCASHGGCNLAGTRGYAGSGGSDAQCMKVLGLFQLQNIRHQPSSNNALGCQLCWPGQEWTYWSAPPSGLDTTCTASSAGSAGAFCRLMCACNE